MEYELELGVWGQNRENFSAVFTKAIMPKACIPQMWGLFLTNWEVGVMAWGLRENRGPVGAVFP